MRYVEIFIIIHLIELISSTSPQNETEEEILNTTEKTIATATLEQCPYPPPDTIAPCKCMADEELRANLHCSLKDSDFDSVLMTRIVQAFGCKNEIFKFDVDLNLNKMLINFDGNGFGKLRVTHFSMRNFSRTGSILAGAIHPPMTTFKIEDSPTLEEHASIATSAFDNVDSLKTVSLGNSFNKIEKYGFRNLTALDSLEVSPGSIASIEEEAFTNLPALSVIDLSNQNLGKLPKSSIKSCRNLTHINLANSNIKTIEKDSINDVTNLRRIDLSNNHICDVGNLIENIQNEDIIMELSGNNIRYLLEEQFRPFVEDRKNKGYINLGDNTLHCQCDMKWLLTTNYKWSDVLFNGTCVDGRSINKINWRLLQKMCPTDECQFYEKEIGRPKEKEIREMTSPEYPGTHHFSNGEVITAKVMGPAILEFKENSCRFYSGYHRSNRDLYITVKSSATNKVLVSSTNWNANMRKIEITQSEEITIYIQYSGSSNSCRFKLETESTKQSDYCM